MLLLKCLWSGNSGLKTSNYYAAKVHPTLPGWVVLADGMWIEEYYFRSV